MIDTLLIDRFSDPCFIRKIIIFLYRDMLTIDTFISLHSKPATTKQLSTLLFSKEEVDSNVCFRLYNLRCIEIKVSILSKSR